jgi:hypothetical protein
MCETKAAEGGADDANDDDKALALSKIAARMSDASDGDEVSVGGMISTIGRRAFGPLLLVFGLIALSPVGAIPGASLVIGALIIVVAAQVLFGQESPWFPSRLKRISVDTRKIDAAVNKLDPYLMKVDTFLQPRWRFMMEPPAPHFVALFCIVLGALMYPLAVVPWGVAAPAFAIVVLSVGLTTHDGIVLAAGLVVAGAALGLSAYLLV